MMELAKRDSPLDFALTLFKRPIATFIGISLLACSITTDIFRLVVPVIQVIWKIGSTSNPGHLEVSHGNNAVLVAITYIAKQKSYFAAKPREHLVIVIIVPLPLIECSFCNLSCRCFFTARTRAFTTKITCTFLSELIDRRTTD